MNLRVIEAAADYTHLALSGRLDIAGVGAIETQFTGYTASRHKPAFVDLSEVTFISSLAIRLFISAAKSLEANQARLILINPQPNIRETLRLSSIEEFIPIVTGKDEALSACKA
ncbi:MAG: hypothetical protein B9S32_02250 [Verrucomicrobia bacterium Tous-C9LFEB]|nr:MAG: hypothetical protein B9S32_02250 [Verrucomicrobia bacterium Tous-C9LFEB]